MREPSCLPDRFEGAQKIGEGAFGIVYDAFDRVRGERVAVKTLPHLRLDARAFYDAFVRLARLTHPHLVQLYDFVEAGGLACYSMQLVDGTDILSYVRGKRPESTPAARVVMGQTLRDGSAYSACSADAIARLRSALAQVADGLAALHAAGYVHGDVTPSNVMVDAGGRVFVADYGPTPPVQHELIAGTAAYMAPEQGPSRGALPASDWYSLGVVVFEALTNALPFAGDAQEMLVRKSTVRAIPPGLLAAGVPSDLESLCMALLERDPLARPTSDDVVQRARAIALAK